MEITEYFHNCVILVICRVVVGCRQQQARSTRQPSHQETWTFELCLIFEKEADAFNCLRKFASMSKEVTKLVSLSCYFLKSPPRWSRCWPLDDKNELVDIDRKRRQFFLVPCALFPKWALSESNEKTLLTFCRRYLRVSLETMVFSPVEPPGWEMGKQGSVAKLVLKYS